MIESQSTSERSRVHAAANGAQNSSRAYITSQTSAVLAATRSEKCIEVHLLARACTISVPKVPSRKGIHARGRMKMHHSTYTVLHRVDCPFQHKIIIAASASSALYKNNSSSSATIILSSSDNTFPSQRVVLQIFAFAASTITSLVRCSPSFFTGLSRPI
jgi:hypothetical protein